MQANHVDFVSELYNKLMPIAIDNIKVYSDIQHLCGASAHQRKFIIKHIWGPNKEIIIQKKKLTPQEVSKLNEDIVVIFAKYVRQGEVIAVVNIILNWYNDLEQSLTPSQVLAFISKWAKSNTQNKLTTLTEAELTLAKCLAFRAIF